VVFLEVPECAKPLLFSLQKSVLKTGAHYITSFLPDDTARHFYELAEDHQLEFFPERFLKGKVDEADHSIMIIAETNKKELEGIHAGKIMKRSLAYKKYKDWRNDKENLGKFTWTLALYGTEEMAREAGISLEEYWQQIIKACYLDFDDPIQRWKDAYKEIDRVLNRLNSMKIKKLHVKSEGVDLIVGLGEGRKWLGGSGRNVPSFEVFISPDCRLTEGNIQFDMPLYRYGNLITDVELKFKDGRVVEAKASKGQDVLWEMIATEGADRIGEFSLTDKRLSRIDKFMAETLFDENFGGEFGNTHLALGSAYHDSYTGKASEMSEEDWESLGFNDSVVHTDIVSTKNREVTAELDSGEKIVIYRNGEFVI
jgi:aminopeptidase